MSENDNPMTNRSDYQHFLTIPTRWQDQDLYGHVNNVVYYAYFDTVVSGYLVSHGRLDPRNDPVIGLCVESFCQFYKELSFPEILDAGLRVGKLGHTSVRYEIGLFHRGADRLTAAGHFVHVFVDRETRKPVSIPDKLRMALAELVG